MQFYVGHHRSYRPAEGKIIQEKKHARGSMVGIFQNDTYYDENFYIVQRENRHCSVVTTIYGYNEEYTEGYEKFDAAEKVFEELLKNKDCSHVYKPFKSSCIRDSQREKVYSWEKFFYRNNNGLTKEQIENFVREFEDEFVLDTIDVSYKESRFCTGGYIGIRMSSWGFNLDILVHELSHVIVKRKVPKKVAGHGPEFVGIFMLMLEKYCGQCLTDMVNKAIKMNVKFVFPAGGLKYGENEKFEYK